MKIKDEVDYNGHKLDGKLHGDTTLTRRIESGAITQITPTGWIEVTLKSGIKVCMPEDQMKIACGLIADVTTGGT